MFNCSIEKPLCRAFVARRTDSTFGLKASQLDLMTVITKAKFLFFGCGTDSVQLRDCAGRLSVRLLPFELVIYLLYTWLMVIYLLYTCYMAGYIPVIYLVLYPLYTCVPHIQSHYHNMQIRILKMGWNHSESRCPSEGFQNQDKLTK